MNRTRLLTYASQLTLCFFTLCPLYSEAQIYKTVGLDGRITYTDTPGDKQATEVDLPTINALPSGQAKFYFPATEKLEAPAPDYKLTISSPANNSDILPDQRNLNVIASIDSGLRKGDQLQLIFNGKAFGTKQQKPNFLIKEIFRGQHQISVAVVDKAGKTLSTSPSVTVNVLRPIVKRQR